VQVLVLVLATDLAQAPALVLDHRFRIQQTGLPVMAELSKPGLPWLI
jgi:hypothetical protein